MSKAKKQSNKFYLVGELGPSCIDAPAPKTKKSKNYGDFYPVQVRIKKGLPVIPSIRKHIDKLLKKEGYEGNAIKAVRRKLLSDRIYDGDNEDYEYFSEYNLGCVVFQTVAPAKPKVFQKSKKDIKEISGSSLDNGDTVMIDCDIYISQQGNLTLKCHCIYLVKKKDISTKVFESSNEFEKTLEKAGFEDSAEETEEEEKIDDRDIPPEDEGEDALGEEDESGELEEEESDELEGDDALEENELEEESDELEGDDALEENELEEESDELEGDDALEEEEEDALIEEEIEEPAPVKKKVVRKKVIARKAPVKKKAVTKKAPVKKKVASRAVAEKAPVKKKKKSFSWM